MTLAMLLRNQYVVGVVSGVLICMIMLGLFQFNSTPRVTGYYQTSVRDSSSQLNVAVTTLRHFSAGPPSQSNSVDTKNQSAATTTAHPTTTTTSATTTTTQAPAAVCNQDMPSTRKPKVYPPLKPIAGIVPLVTENHQDDDTSVLDMLYNKVRVLCWVMTTPTGLQEKAIHSYNTWGRRCNKILFFSSAENSSFPAPVIKVDTEEGRDHLTAKTMHAFKYIYDHYYKDYEWFMKADDDTFVIVENLRYFLSDRNPMEGVYYGHHFKTIVEPQGYYGGGGGYVISKFALYKFGVEGFHNPQKCREDGGAEDAEFGKCMQNLDVRTAESYDERGRSRFHGLNPELHIKGQYPGWYYNMDSHGGKHGVESISNYPISFHYVTPQAMHDFMFYVYHLRVYGIKDMSRPKLHAYYESEIP